MADRPLDSQRRRVAREIPSALLMLLSLFLAGCSERADTAQDTSAVPEIAGDVAERQDGLDGEPVPSEVAAPCIGQPDGSLCPGGRCRGATCRLRRDDLAAGPDLTCALDEEQVACWGKVKAGPPFDVPGTVGDAVLVSGLADTVAMAIGQDHACALSAAGVVRCWGDDFYGQVGAGGPGGAGSPLAPTVVLENVTQISAGSAHSCAVRFDGSLWCWGRNANGEIGDALGGHDMSQRQAVPVRVKGLGAVAFVACGSEHTCAVRMDGSTWCWGADTWRRLGFKPKSAPVNVPVQVPGLEPAVDIAASSYQTCIATADGRIVCWGALHHAQVVAMPGRLPHVVSGASSTIRVAVSEAAVCALEKNGRVACAGWGQTGQVGTGSWAELEQLVTVPEMAPVTTLAGGLRHVCARRTDDSVWCWGDNTVGQLGVPSAADHPTPVAVAGVASATALAVGDEHTCVRLADGAVRCWGSNHSGEAAGFHVVADEAFSSAGPPVAVAAQKSLAAGAWQTCAVGTGSELTCWGGLPLGPNPELKPLEAKAAAVATGEGYACALTEDGTVACWGENFQGQLGRAGPGASSPTPVPGLGDVTSIAAGRFTACALRSGGLVDCWGANPVGLLDAEAPGGAVPPVPLLGFAGAQALALGEGHICAILQGRVFCAGANESGQLGDGSITPRLAPVEVAGTTGATALTAGRRHSCAVLGSGQVLCWGANEHGQLGHGALSPESTFAASPVAVAQLAGAVSVGGGAGHTCALRVDGTVWCWGANGLGQVGDGQYPRAAWPVRATVTGP